jgi:hypothetical protein
VQSVTVCHRFTVANTNSEPKSVPQPEYIPDAERNSDKFANTLTNPKPKPVSEPKSNMLPESFFDSFANIICKPDAGNQRINLTICDGD